MEFLSFKLFLFTLCFGEDDLRGCDSVLLGSISQNGLCLLHPALREKPSGGLRDEPPKRDVDHAWQRHDN
uniref:Secreted protein n=1 Tax=Anguilla anguilla TaxID=7936 RepID=A0A0E9WEL9_ANGAN